MRMSAEFLVVHSKYDVSHEHSEMSETLVCTVQAVAAQSVRIICYQELMQAVYVG